MAIYYEFQINVDNKELSTIIAIAKSHDEELPLLKRVIRKCEKLIDHKYTPFEETN